MPTFTPNLALIKPAGPEDALVSQLNSNSDIIDDAIFDLQTAVGTDSGILVNKITVAANWTLGVQQVRKVGKMVQVTFVFTRTNSVVNASADGGIGDVLMGTINDAAYRPAQITGCAPTSPSILFSAVIDTAGLISLSALAPNNDVNIGDSIAASAFFLVP